MHPFAWWCSQSVVVVSKLIFLPSWSQSLVWWACWLTRWVRWHHKRRTGWQSVDLAHWWSESTCSHRPRCQYLWLSSRWACRSASSDGVDTLFQTMVGKHLLLPHCRVDHDVDSCEQLILRWRCLSNLVDWCNCLCVDVHHGVDALCCLWSWGIWWCCWLCCVLLLLSIPILMALIPSLILPLVLIPVICWILIPILLTPILLISFFLNMIDCDSAILSDVARLAALVASILSFSFAFDAFLLWLLSFSWWSFWCSFEWISLSWWISSLISSFSFSFVVSSVESFSLMLSFAFLMALLSFSFVAFPAAMVSCADVHWCWTLVVVSWAAAVGIVVLKLLHSCEGCCCPVVLNDDFSHCVVVSHVWCCKL